MPTQKHVANYIQPYSPSKGSTLTAMVFFMVILMGTTTSAKYGISKDTERISVLRAKIRKRSIPGCGGQDREEGSYS